MQHLIRANLLSTLASGNCYVAFAGLPNPQPDHAVIMAKFAWECKMTLVVLLKDLARSLGPATNELSMRFGLHSGAVTVRELVNIR